MDAFFMHLPRVSLSQLCMHANDRDTSSGVNIAVDRAAFNASG